ncbi:MAG: MaoC family dehydratase N-terminal domain-containing protein [Burkholderiales bacterium]|nr:MaoC family dehydratase N-terminal domain-containing protein [Burkholderiales bacterium]
MPTAIDAAVLERWIGRTEEAADTVTAFPVAALAATLDRDDPSPREGDALPPLWHWLYFLPVYRHAEAGSDGHRARGAFLPPVELPRRMWAGSRMTFTRALRVGERVHRVSTVADVKHKSGRSGALVFVVVRHEVGGAAGHALTEEHDIVYRDAPRPGEPLAAPQAAPVEADWTREVAPDPLLLFRYSALTFNGHRIHYDRRYCTDVEGYPGLVVHGPLLATLLLDLLRRERPQARVTSFRFRAVSPVFDTAPLTVCGAPLPGGHEARLWVRRQDGALAMDATATLA